MSTLKATFVPVKSWFPVRSLVWLAILLLLVPVVAPISALPLASSGKPPTNSPPARAATADYGKLPLSFEANYGQMNEQVQFLARSHGYRLYLTPTETVLSLGQQQQRATVRMKLLGANAQAAVRGNDQLPGVSNYLIGNDRTKWRTNVPHFAQVKYAQVYPGVDMLYYSKDRQLEYDFIVAPGVNPDVIQMAVTGATEMRLDENGDLVMKTPVGEMRQHKPVIYQQLDGNRQEIAGNFVLGSKNRVSFALGKYDHSRELVIDPTLDYSTYLGGYDDDKNYAIALTGCSSGNCDALVTGETAATDFPPGSGYSYQSDQTGTDTYVAKLDSTGTSLTFATYLGGNGEDVGFGIKVDGSGNIYAVGRTTSTNFPTNNQAQTSQGGNDAFLVKLNSSGTTLSYGTYLGGSANDDAAGLALSGSTAYVVGRTSSSAATFPETSNCAQATLSAGPDAFFAKIDTTSSGLGSLTYVTYLGGSTTDEGKGIAVDSNGDAYLTGFAQSTNFPTASAYDSSRDGLQDAFVAKINPAGNGSADLTYSTYLGGGGRDGGWGIALDGTSAIVVGETVRNGFPTVMGSHVSSTSGGSDAFVTKFASNGGSLTFSAILSGSGDETAFGVALDSSNNVFITGETTSTTSFDVVNNSGFQSSSGGGTDAFVAKFNSSGSSLSFSTWHGGSLTDVGRGIAVSSSTAYFAGFTNTLDSSGTPFPIVPDANQMTPAYQWFSGGNGGYDGFVGKISGL